MSVVNQSNENNSIEYSDPGTVTRKSALSGWFGTEVTKTAGDLAVCNITVSLWPYFEQSASIHSMLYSNMDTFSGQAMNTVHVYSTHMHKLW